MIFFQLYWQGLIALFAFIVSVVSTIISFRTFKLQREHNIKSVKPIIHIGQWDYENSLFVTLQNMGIGLAIVNKLNVVNHREESKNTLYDWLPKILSGGANYSEYFTGYKSFVVQPGQTIKLMQVPIDTNNSEQIKTREQLRSILRQLTINIDYCDIYDNTMPTTTTALSHFSRTDNVNCETA